MIVTSVKKATVELSNDEIEILRWALGRISKADCNISGIDYETFFQMWVEVEKL